MVGANETTEEEQSSPTSTAQTGVAGRTNYAQWDKLATDLVEQVETEEQAEAESENAKVRSFVCLFVCLFVHSLLLLLFV